MPQATVTVRYVNPPKDGGKRGSIKTIDDEFYGVWPETFHLFEPGRTYHVEYSERTQDGRTFRNVKKVTPANSPAAPLPVISTASPKTLTDAEWQIILALRNLLGAINAPPR